MGSAPSPFARDDLIAAVCQRPRDDRLNDAVHFDRLREILQSLVGHLATRLVIVRLEEIDVDPVHGRRGLGTQLVLRVCDWAAANGNSGVTLTTFRDAPWNMPFYARLGFEVVPESEMAPAVRAIVRAETLRGLDPARRVVMRRAVR